LNDVQLIRALFAAIIARSARYIAVAIAAIVIRILKFLMEFINDYFICIYLFRFVQPATKISVGIDGSIYHKVYILYFILFYLNLSIRDIKKKSKTL
jgi:hexokinase